MSKNDKSSKNGKKLDNDSPFAQLNDVQWRYITAMVENPSFSKKDVAQYIGISERTIYNWVQVAPYVDEALQAARRDLYGATLARRKQLIMKALAVKASGLDSDDESIRQRVASELLEWELGKASNRTEHTGADGAELQIRVIYDDTLSDD